MTMMLTPTSLATCAVSAWMFVMYFVLRHPGYEWRAAMASAVFLGAAAAAAQIWRLHVGLRVALLAWAVALGAVGIWALRTSDEGWALVAGLLFVVEAVVTVATLGPRPAPLAGQRFSR